MGHGKFAIPAGPNAPGGGNPSVKGRNNEKSDTGKGDSSLDQLNQNMADITIDSAQDSGWEMISKKSKNQPVASDAKSWGSSTTSPNPWCHSWAVPTKGCGSNTGGEKTTETNWGQAVVSHRLASRVSPKLQQPNKGCETTNVIALQAIPPPLEHGCQWADRGASAGTHSKAQEESVNIKPVDTWDDGDDDTDDEQDDSDDDLSDNSDSDASEKSHETRKRNKWLKKFFEVLDDLKQEQINDPNRQWHCPACHDGPGAIDWYRGMQPLMTHAKTRRTRRVHLHRELAALLEEELQRRGIVVVPEGEVFGKWKGLCKMTSDHEIVWPPMVVIMNTLLEMDENDKWIGMGNQELVDYFSNYAAMKARHSYGPTGHRGMSILIFEPSAMGYLEAERLDKQFADEGIDRDAWGRRRVLFYPGGKRQLYGFLATKEDISIFNQHSAGKSRLKFEMKSYQEMVVAPMRKMSEYNQKLTLYKRKAVKQERRCKAFEESFGAVSQKLRDTVEENMIVRLRTTAQCEENKEELDYQDRFLKEQMERMDRVYKEEKGKIHKATEEREENFEMLLQESVTNEEHKHRREEIEKVISSQVKGVGEFEAKRERLTRAHEQKKVGMKQKHLDEEVELEKEYQAALIQLMDEYTHGTVQDHTNE